MPELVTDKKKRRLDPVGIVFSLGICSVIVYLGYLKYRPDHEHLAKQLRQQGFVEMQQGNAEAARDRYEQAAHEAASGTIPLQLPGILLDLAETYVRLGDRAKAVAALSQAVAIYDKLDSAKNDTMGSDTKDVLNRKRLHALVTLARLEAKVRKLKEAKSTYKRALTYVTSLSDYNEADLRKEYLTVVIGTGDAVEAGHLVRQIEVSSGTESDLVNMVKRGASGITGGDLKDAEKDLEEGLRLARELDNSSRVEECLVLIGVCRIATGRIDEAKTALEEASTLNNHQRIEALQLLSYSMDAKGQRAASDRLFDESVRENLQLAVDSRQLFLLISAFYNRGDREAASRVAKFCLRHHSQLLLNPEANKASLHRVLASESQLAGDPEGGVKHWQSLSKLLGKPQDLTWMDVPQLTGIADSFTRKGEGDKAEKYWRLALQKLDRDPGRLTSYARQLAYQISLTKRAPQEYEEVVKLMYKAWRYMPLPLNYPLHMMKQDVDLVDNTYRRMGVVPDRKKIFSTALMYVEKWNAPDLLAYTLEELAKCYVVERNFNAAQPLLERVIAIKKSQKAKPDELLNNELDLVSCYYNIGDGDKLRKYVEKLLATAYKNQDNEKHMKSCCYFHLGASFEREGKAAEADAMYEKGRQFANARVCAGLVGTIAASLSGTRKESLLMNQIAAFEKEKARPSLEQGVLCTILADQYNGEKKYTQAERYYQLGLGCFKPFENTDGGKHFLKIWREHHDCLLTRVAESTDKQIPPDAAKDK